MEGHAERSEGSRRYSGQMNEPRTDLLDLLGVQSLQELLEGDAGLISWSRSPIVVDPVVRPVA